MQKKTLTKRIGLAKRIMSKKDLDIKGRTAKMHYVKEGKAVKKNLAK